MSFFQKGRFRGLPAPPLLRSRPGSFTTIATNAPPASFNRVNSTPREIVRIARGHDERQTSHEPMIAKQLTGLQNWYCVPRILRLRTSVITSLQNIVTRSVGGFLSGTKMKQLSKDHVAEVLGDEEYLALTGRVSKEVIDHLTGQIKKIEKAALKRIRPLSRYRYLVTMPGVGEVLGLTIALETGDIGRFSGVGNYASYCRKVPVSWTSNEKKKGTGTKKNGNKFLSWAFAEAAQLARRFDPVVRAWYNRKTAKTNMMVAQSALAHKLARAAYHMMKEETPFDRKRLFGYSVGPGGETDQRVGKTTRFD